MKPKTPLLGGIVLNMTDTQTLVAHRRQAHTQLDSVVKKEAFINTLQKTLGNLTTDIKVGTRFISTNDYDGNLYECKQEPYSVCVMKPVIQDFQGKKKVMKIESSCNEFQIDLCRLRFPRADLYKPQLRGLHYVENNDDRYDSIFDDMEGTYITIKDVHSYEWSDFGDVYKASELAETKNREENHDEYWEKINNTPPHKHTEVFASYKPKELTFFIERVIKTTATRGEEVWANFVAEGYFPLIQRSVSRIWIRKCNIVGEALGKNVDSSHKSINFTQEIMSVREMLQEERYKLTKVRKVFNEAYPAKCKSKSLKSLREESERLQPTLERLEKLIDDLWTKDVKVPAYYCKKYGFLIPIKAEFVVDVSGNTIEVEMANTQQKIHQAVDDQMALRKAVVEEFKEIITP